MAISDKGKKVFKFRKTRENSQKLFYLEKKKAEPESEAFSTFTFLEEYYCVKCDRNHALVG